MHEIQLMNGSVKPRFRKFRLRKRVRNVRLPARHYHCLSTPWDITTTIVLPAVLLTHNTAEVTPSLYIVVATVGTTVHIGGKRCCLCLVRDRSEALTLPGLIVLRNNFCCFYVLPCLISTLLLGELFGCLVPRTPCSLLIAHLCCRPTAASLRCTASSTAPRLCCAFYLLVLNISINCVLPSVRWTLPPRWPPPRPMHASSLLRLPECLSSSPFLGNVVIVRTTGCRNVFRFKSFRDNNSKCFFNSEFSLCQPLMPNGLTKPVSLPTATYVPSC
ncbi:hypothetical protein E2C01_013403 [Portunus trituberculatus]|uniref:Uncharacterized protein n=1 Tax=Portunus trituberculatus TaxID=210409 RepID=A0A5B7DH00_PORTR|nr:hypothetical protein [Portunus trituberculatus]